MATLDEYIDLFYGMGGGVFPLKGTKASTHAAGKMPDTPNGKNDAVYTPAELPTIDGAAWGLLPPKGVCVVDIDNKQEPGKPNGFESIEAMPGYDEVACSNTLIVKTPGGGLHLYFECEEGLPSTNAVAPGIDVRAGDGRFYIVGPGSQTAAGEYAVVVGKPMARLPEFLQRALTAGKTRSAKQVVPTGIGVEAVDKKDLRSLAKKWEGRGRMASVRASQLKSVLKGKPYAASGSIRDTTRDLCYWLAREKPHLDPRSLAEQVFEPAWVEMFPNYQNAKERGGRGGIESDFYRSWETALRRIEDERAAREEERKSVVAQRILHARYGQTSEPYSEQERKRVADWLGVDMALVKNRFILQSGRSYFLLGLDRQGQPTYIGPRVGDDLPAFAREILSPWGDMVETETFDEGAKKFRTKTRQELVDEYGIAIGEVRGSFCGESYFDAPNSTVYIRHAVPAEYEAKWSDSVDSWLRRLTGGGEEYERLMDWVSVALDLHQGAPAVLFHGAPGSGKSLFAKAVAGLFGSLGTTKGNRLNNFNSEILGCPVVEFGERLGHNLDDFKELISSTVQVIEPKGLGKFQVDGALRIIMSANNLSSLRTKGSLTVYDLQALEDRLIVIETCAEKLNASQVREWEMSDAVERHLTWVIQNRQAAEAGRFACLPYVGNMFRRAMLEGNEPFQEAAQVLVDHIMGVGFGAPKGKGVWRLEDGSLAVCVSEVLTTRGRGSISPKRFTSALEGVGYTGGHRRRLDGKPVRFGLLPLDGFRAVCEAVDVDADELYEGLEVR